MGVQTPQRKVSPSQISHSQVSPSQMSPSQLSPSQMYGVPMYEKPHTLKNYALDHFRSPLPSPKSSLNGTMLRVGPTGLSNMWRYSRGPMAQPLLRRLLNKEELAHQACVIFQTILRYMGDIPGRQSRLGLELTDLIFAGPLKQVLLNLSIMCGHAL